MKKLHLLGAVLGCLAIVSFNSNAALTSVDWQTPGDNLITRDTSNGFDWLDLTVTIGRTYPEVIAALGSGGSNAGAIPPPRPLPSGEIYYPPQDPNVVEKLINLWGATGLDQVGNSVSYFIQDNPFNHPSGYNTNVGRINLEINPLIGEIVTNTDTNVLVDLFRRADTGSALYRPIPPALWLRSPRTNWYSQA